MPKVVTVTLKFKLCVQSKDLKVKKRDVTTQNAGFPNWLGVELVRAGIVEMMDQGKISAPIVMTDAWRDIRVQDLDDLSRREMEKVRIGVVLQPSKRKL